MKTKLRKNLGIFVWNIIMVRCHTYVSYVGMKKVYIVTQPDDNASDVVGSEAKLKVRFFHSKLISR